MKIIPPEMVPPTIKGFIESPNCNNSHSLLYHQRALKRLSVEASATSYHASRVAPGFLMPETSLLSSALYTVTAAIIGHILGYPGN